MATYIYPTAREIQAIGADLMAQETLNDPILSRVFPITTVDAPTLEWTLDDDDYGLQQLRGIDGAPPGVIPTGKTAYLARPGYFGEHMTITEDELTLRGGSIIGSATVSIADQVASRMRQLAKREVTRIRKMVFDLLTTGTFSVSGKGSTITYTDTYSVQARTGSAWGTAASGTPLADLRTVQQDGSQYGVNFGASAIAVMNRVTANKMFANTNSADLGGRRGPGGSTVTGLAAVNQVLLGEDLPTVVIFDEGYKNDSGSFTKFVADLKIIVIGTRNAGDKIGEYRLTRNLVNPNGAPGAYSFVADYAQGINAPKEIPPRIVVHRGHNGGLVMFRPKAVEILTVT